MLQSKLFGKTVKEDLGDQTTEGARLLLRAGFIDKIAAGVYALLPLGYLVLQNIENIIAREMAKLGAQRIQMNALIPRANWEKTSRWTTLDVLYKVKGKSAEEYGLGATHEEEAVPIAKKYAISYKDFPFAIYQIQTKFRDELRPKSGLLRTREFSMKDLYSFHLTAKDCDEYYQLVKESYFKIFKEVGLAQAIVLTLASGGTFSKFSHEFQALCDAGEDTIFLCNNCGLTINREIKDEYPQCPECGCADFTQRKGIEVGNIFQLGTKYSDAFDFTVADSCGKKIPVLMNCYGIGLTRLMGAVAEIWHNDAGLIWPQKIAPFTIHLLELSGGADQEKISKEAQKIYDNLQKAGLTVLYDQREEKSAGEKLNDADLLGMPYRVLVSPKTIAQESVEVKKRSEDNIQLVKIEHLTRFDFGSNENLP